MVALVLSTAACRYTSEATYTTEASASPAGYRVLLKGDLNSKPRAEWTSYFVEAEIVGRTWRQSLVIFEADRRDSTFREEYPSEKWIAPNVLYFRSANARGTSERTVEIGNASGEKMEALKVACGDLSLAFDIDAGRLVVTRCPVRDWLSLDALTTSGRTFRSGVLNVPASPERLTVVIDTAGNASVEGGVKP